ncbi:MAG: hypothetical protein HZA50_13465 [Planctomycetes bacterium]|nr:hypothetical protein [Planctomycetota bacterium]
MNIKNANGSNQNNGQMPQKRPAGTLRQRVVRGVLVYCILVGLLSLIAICIMSFCSRPISNLGKAWFVGGCFFRGLLPGNSLGYSSAIRIIVGIFGSFLVFVLMGIPFIGALATRSHLLWFILVILDISMWAFYIFMIYGEFFWLSFMPG